ncbi:MAG: undecaprenyl-phosphate glucose phosphotransferase [Melioribacteraceae bacterium]|nr:MAG: undecaprenyl-phosphate glucose phosphotransferase [Melioribacteraceae bacterium]
MFANQKSILNFKVVTDYLLLNGSFFSAAMLAQSWNVLIDKPMMFVLLLSLNIVWFYISRAVKLYDEFAANRFFDYIIKLFKITAVCVLFSVVFIFFSKELLFTRNFIIFNTLLLFISLSAKHFVIKKIFRVLKRKNKNTRVLSVIGTGDTGSKFKDSLIQNAELNYSFKGFISPEEINELESILAEQEINELVIALEMKEYEKLDSILKICDKLAVKTYIIPDYFSILGGRFNFSLFGNYPIITVRNNPLDEIQWRIVKRTFDILFSGVVLLITGWWFFPLLAIIIKTTSKGNVFFIQDRLGRNNETFRCLKFRTMTTEHSSSKAGFNVIGENDSRVTGIGAFLRKFNLDEFPQFINVIKGDMSVVGPRPHAIPFNNSYGEIVEEIKLRHRVKPGITGWAQIHGLRGDVIDLEEQIKRTKKRISFDIWYIENWSFLLDLKIIFETVAQIALKKNTGN